MQAEAPKHGEHDTVGVCMLVAKMTQYFRALECAPRKKHTLRPTKGFALVQPLSLLSYLTPKIYLTEALLSRGRHVLMVKPYKKSFLGYCKTEKT